MIRIINSQWKLCLYILLSYIFISCNVVCENKILDSKPSPNGKYKVVKFARTCGATTGMNNQISILKINKKLPNNPGNIFISDEFKNLEIFWITDDELFIRFNSKNGNIYKKLSDFDDIKIVYEDLYTE